MTLIKLPLIHAYFNAKILTVIDILCVVPNVFALPIFFTFVFFSVSMLNRVEQP